MDLGFSAFVVGLPEWLRAKCPEKLKDIDYIQFTLGKWHYELTLGFS